jgi:hypothetical protein
MGKKKSDTGQLKETPQERQLAEIALQRYQHYKSTWQPLQQQAIALVNKMAEPTSADRGEARTNMTGGISVEADRASDTMRAMDSNRGVTGNSGNAKLRQEMLGTERAQAQGIAGAAADSVIDNAYVEGLSSLIAVGRNQSEQAMDSTARAATMGQADAESRARRSAAKRAGIAKYAGIGIGAASQMMGGAGPGFLPGGNTGEAMGTGAAPGDATGTFVGRFN